jgi:hypothetical protein
VCLGGGGVADPEFDGVGGEVDEGEVFAIRGPGGLAGTRAGRESDVELLAVGDMDQVEFCGAGGNAVSARSVVLAVVSGLDADSSEAQEGRGDAGDRGVVLPGD